MELQAVTQKETQVRWVSAGRCCPAAIALTPGIPRYIIYKLINDHSLRPFLKSFPPSPGTHISETKQLLSDFLLCTTSNGKSMDDSTHRPSGPSGGTKPYMSHLQVLISVLRSPDPTYSRASWPYFPTKYAHLPAERISYIPRLLLCAVFCHAARSS